MNKIVSDIIDRYILYQLHKEKSAVSQFHAERLQNLKTEEFLSFYGKPNTPEVNLNQEDIIENYAFGKYFFESQIKDNEKCNDNVTGNELKNVIHKCLFVI